MEDNDKRREPEEGGETEKGGALKRWGFYIAVTAAVVAAGIISYNAVEDMLDASIYQSGGIDEAQIQSEQTQAPSDGSLVKPEPEKAPLPQTEQAVKPEQPEPAEQQTPSTSERAETPKEDDGEEQGGQSEPTASEGGDVPFISKYVLPVTGELTTRYSGDKLVYNETTGDWRTHNGVDLKAAEGADVVAVAGGRVLSVTDSELWGKTISIKLDSGYTVVYAGLASASKLDPGSPVSQGEVVGTVGNSSVIERGDGPHLHVEVLLGDRYIDPLSLIQ